MDSCPVGAISLDKETEETNMENIYVSGKTLVGEIVNTYPEAIEVLMASGMHCLGCPASQAESLEDACAVHGLEVFKVVEAINQKIEAARK